MCLHLSIRAHGSADPNSSLHIPVISSFLVTQLGQFLILWNLKSTSQAESHVNYCKAGQALVAETLIVRENHDYFSKWT